VLISIESEGVEEEESVTLNYSRTCLYHLLRLPRRKIDVARLKKSLDVPQALRPGGAKEGELDLDPNLSVRPLCSIRQFSQDFSSLTREVVRAWAEFQLKEIA